jgi:hypothetical protein
MPEPPDFDQLARRLLVLDPDAFVREIAELLRLAWNARGAADQKAVADRLATLTGWVTSEPYRQHLRDAIAALDRCPVLTPD